LTPQSDNQEKRRSALSRAAQELQGKLIKMGTMQREDSQKGQL